MRGRVAHVCRFDGGAVSMASERMELSRNGCGAESTWGTRKRSERQTGIVERAHRVLRRRRITSFHADVFLVDRIMVNVGAVP